MSRFEGKRVVVTGAAGGLGQEVAAQFRAEGAHVLATDLAGPEGIVPVNLTDEDAVLGLAERALNDLGGVDVLCHVAGVQQFSQVGTYDAAKVRLHLDVNCVAPMILTQALAPALANGGAVVAVASISAVHVQPYNAVYCASKAALLMGMKALAVELAGQGTRVNCVSPGGIDTSMPKESAKGLDPNINWELLLQRGQCAIPGFMPPSEVANSILFLASDQASSITGANLVVDRGVVF